MHTHHRHHIPNDDQDPFGTDRRREGRGAFGPEASAPALVFGAMVAIAALFVARRRGRLRSLPDMGK